MGVSENALLARTRGYLLRGGVLAALALLMMLLYASTAWADTFTVTNLNDSGPGSLREAMNAAEARAGADEIVFADGVGGTITLSSQLPTVTDAAGLVIDGGGDITVSGNDAVRVFRVSPGGELTLRDLTVSEGFAWLAGVDGGGILVEDGRLMVIDSTISDNRTPSQDVSSAGWGGGIANLGGTVEVTGSNFYRNDANFGGGIANRVGTVEVTDSNLSGNVALNGSGGIENNLGTLTVTKSNLSGNSGDAVINRNAGTLTVANSTLSDNLGVGISNDGTLTVANSTLSGNRFGIANSFRESTATLRNTIVANSTLGSNCLEFGNPITDGGYNIDDDGTCGFTPETGSLSNTDPLLDPAGLADNGGPTETIALLPESPAVDLVGQNACPPPSTDQRGVARPQGQACDSGAFELVQGPQTKADCKQGGYKEFGFKNQGQCIASLQRNAEAIQ